LSEMGVARGFFPDQLAARSENLLVQRIEEVLSLDHFGDAVERVIPDQDAAEYGLFGFRAPRRLPERRLLWAARRSSRTPTSERRVLHTRCPLGSDVDFSFRHLHI
jgi:hypothetical protein